MLLALLPFDNAFARTGAWQSDYNSRTWRPYNLFDKAWAIEVFKTAKRWEDIPQPGVDKEWDAFEEAYKDQPFDVGLKALEEHPKADLLKKENDLIILYRYWYDNIWLHPATMDDTPETLAWGWNGDWGDFNARGCNAISNIITGYNSCDVPDWRTDEMRARDKKVWDNHVARIKKEYELYRSVSDQEYQDLHAKRQYEELHYLSKEAYKRIHSLSEQDYKDLYSRSEKNYKDHYSRSEQDYKDLLLHVRGRWDELITAEWQRIQALQ